MTLTPLYKYKLGKLMFFKGRQIMYNGHVLGGEMNTTPFEFENKGR